MLKNKLPFSELAKKISRSGKGFHDIQLIHPNREWTMGFVIMVVLFVVSAAWSYQSYSKYNGLSVTDKSSTSTESVVYRESLVKAALTELQQQQSALEEYKKQVEAQQKKEAVEKDQKEVVVSATTTNENNIVTTSTSSIEIQSE